MHNAQPHLLQVRAGLDQFRATVDRLVADHRALTREVAGRLAVPPDEEAPEAEVGDVGEDNDLVDSWMADPRGAPTPRGGPYDGVVARLESGELSWGDLLSGRAGDRDAVAVRDFLAHRLAEARRQRGVS